MENSAAYNQSADEDFFSREQCGFL